MKREPGARHYIHRLAFDDLLLPTRTHFPQGPQLTKIVALVETQLFKA